MAPKTTLNLATMTENEFNSEMEKSYKSMKAGKGIPAKKAFALIKRQVKEKPVAICDRLKK